MDDLERWITTSIPEHTFSEFVLWEERRKAELKALTPLDGAMAEKMFNAFSQGQTSYNLYNNLLGQQRLQHSPVQNLGLTGLGGLLGGLFGGYHGR